MLLLVEDFFLPITFYVAQVNLRNTTSRKCNAIKRFAAIEKENKAAKRLLSFGASQ